MKKVLIVTYYFPPSGGPGVQRILKFVKYLPEYGWDPIVLTVENGDFPARDETVFEEIPTNVQVIRTYIPEPYIFYRKFTGRKKDEAIDIAILSLDQKRPKKRSERFAQFVRRSIFVPDARIGWLPFAVFTGLKILRREPIDLLFSSAPPYTCHLIGLMLHYFTGLFWIADFRDPWTDFLSTPIRTGLSKRIDKYLEKKVYQTADRVVVAWPGILDDLQFKFSYVSTEKCHVIPNGFDFLDNYFYQPKFSLNERFIITYLGSLYGKRDATHFIQALTVLAAQDEEFSRSCLLRIVGRVGSTVLECLQRNLSQEMYEIIPYVPHHVAVEYLLSSDVLLLIVDDSPLGKNIVPGKIYEYIGSGKEVLALAFEESEVASILRESGTGQAIHSKDTYRIKSKLRELYDQWHKGLLRNCTMNDSSLQKYSRKYLTGNLAALFEQVISNKGLS